MGVCRQAKDEIYNCPPVLLIIGRADDGWLATWSRADAVISHPIDPVALAQELAGLMRRVAVTARDLQPRACPPLRTAGARHGCPDHLASAARRAHPGRVPDRGREPRGR